METKEWMNRLQVFILFKSYGISITSGQQEGCNLKDACSGMPYTVESISTCIEN